MCPMPAKSVLSRASLLQLVAPHHEAHYQTKCCLDTLGFEPRAFRMRSGCDTTTPCALEETAGCGSHTPYQTSHPDSADVHHGNVLVMCIPQPWMLTTLQKSMLADQTHLLHIFGKCTKCFWACCRLFFNNQYSCSWIVAILLDSIPSTITHLLETFKIRFRFGLMAGGPHPSYV